MTDGYFSNPFLPETEEFMGKLVSLARQKALNNGANFITYPFFCAIIFYISFVGTLRRTLFTVHMKVLFEIINI